MNVNRSFAHLLRATHREDPSGLSDVAMWSDSLPAFKVAAKALFDTGLYSATEIEDAHGHVLIAHGYQLETPVRLSNAVIDQLHWIEDHGSDRLGYIANYASFGRSLEDAEAIYDADQARLRRLMERGS